jgi:hypothetical protein
MTECILPTTLPPRVALTEPPLVISTDSRYPESIDLEGRMVAGGEIEYLGKATRQANGTYVCLARVGQALCAVEVRLTPLEEVNVADHTPQRAVEIPDESAG